MSASTTRVGKPASADRRPGAARPTAFVVAVVATLAAAGEQVVFALGWDGLPGPVPWPFLLVAAPAWVLARPWPEPSARVRRAVETLGRVPPAFWLVGVLVLVCAVWLALQGAVPYLGHDESVYAAKARSWLTGAPTAQWDPHRAPGLPALGVVALAVSESVGAVRVVGLGLALLAFAITYLVAARLSTHRRAAVVAVVVLSGVGIVRRLPEFLSDIAAAGLLVATAYLVVRVRERPDAGAWLALPFVALAAFYVRYGAIAGLGAVALAALVVWGPRAWLAHPRRLGVVAGVFALGLAPHLAYATSVEGSPLALLLSAGSGAGRAYPGDGLVFYLVSLPYAFGGYLGGIVMIAGLLAAGAAARRLVRAEPRPADRRTAFLGVAAVLQTLLLGLTAHGEVRFLFMAVLLLTILGVQAIAEVAGRRAGEVLVGVAALALITVPATAQIVAAKPLAAVTSDRVSMVDVAERLRDDRPCLVVTGFQPEHGWYSGCATRGYVDALRGPWPTGRTVMFVLYERGRYQAGEAQIRRLIGQRPSTTLDLAPVGRLGAAKVITVPAR